MHLFRVVLLIFLIPSSLAANCSFRTGNYIQELGNPNYLKSIEINTPKSAKFFKNFLRIITVPTQNIPPELKKKFKASITVKYTFGSCTYKGTIKQNGDWRDHIDFDDDGNPVRSLNVKLNDGNILNAVKFKLLLPETRNNLHEVLGALLLKEIGFITPETFQVNVSVNGITNIMLFQEDAQKEMLERNNRREGPIFEGDEALLWSYEDYENFELSKLSLARMSNENWFLKGPSSENISLNSFGRLQYEYLRSEADADTRNLFPNGLSDTVFQEYFLYLRSMNGLHGLAGHNRRFYFNTFSENFEPIYYDGDLTLNKPASYDGLFIDFGNFSVDHEYINKFSTLKSSKNVLRSFQDRTLVSDEVARIFFYSSLTNIEQNLENLLEFLSIEMATKKINLTKNTHNGRMERYLSNQINHALAQDVVIDLQKVGGNYIGHLPDGSSLALSKGNVAEIIGNNDISEMRTVYLPKREDNFIVETLKVPLQTSGLLGEIEYSKGLKISIDKLQKKITFIQGQSTDWALIKNTNLKDWTIGFLGTSENYPETETYEQRFNYRGMTGCLNFYKTLFNETQLVVEGGRCEDSLNIVDSSGSLKSINIANAFSDGVDIDFSNIEIKKLIVENAGNDCFDISGGVYLVMSSKLSKCGDKGASVGEHSTVQFGELNVSNSSIGISSKDLSLVTINKATIKALDLCYEVYQKKQEFGGAVLEIDNLFCSNESFVDENSFGRVILE